MALNPADPNSYTQRLVKVRAAINEVLDGVQSTSYEGRSMTMANLLELRQLEIAYAAEAEKERAACGNGRNRISYFVPIT